MDAGDNFKRLAMSDHVIGCESRSKALRLRLCDFGVGREALELISHGKSCA
jgi:hypothetical protein